MPKLFDGYLRFKEVDGRWMCRECGEEWDEGQREYMDQFPEFCMNCRFGDVRDTLEDGLSNIPIPERMKGGIRRYVYEGIPPGGFLQAVMEGNLIDAWLFADTDNRLLLHHYASLAYNFIPSSAIGSKENVKKWKKEVIIPH